MISIANIRLAAVAIDPVFLRGPQYQSEGLSELLGVSLICKIETANPLGSFKGRGVSWWFRTQYPLTHIVCASAGNFGQAVAYMGRQHRVPVDVFVAETANPAKIHAIERLGATIHLQGQDFDAAKEEAVQFAAKEGLMFLEDGNNNEFAEGAGAIGLELCNYRDPIDVIYVPVGNGALVNGIGAWFKDQHPCTKVIGVCAEEAPAMAYSWQQGQPVSTALADTIADGIAVRKPIPAALTHLADAVDDIILVSDAQIIAAMRAYYEHENLVTEPAGAVSLAGAMVNAEKDQGKRVATLVCGANIDPRYRDVWLSTSKS